MLHQKIAFGLLAACASLAAADATSDVHVLKEDEFEPFIKQNPLALVKFYAPWCGHCKALAPEYEEAATTLKEKNIKLAKVDCTEQVELCKKHEVEGYPTLKVFRRDNVSPYTHPRKADAIVSYMVKQSLPAVSDLSKDTIEDFKKADKVVIVAYVAADDKASKEIFTGLAEKLRDDFLFGAVHDAALAEAEGAKVPSIVLYKSFDDGKDVFSEAFEHEAIVQFAKTAATPLFGEIGPDTYSGYMEAQKPLAYVFAETEEERKSFAEKLKPIAKKHKGKINFATIDAKAFGAHAGNLNLKADKFPAFAIHDIVGSKKYPFNQDDEVSHDLIMQFADDYLAGKLEPSVKSEPVPEKQDGPVTIVVAKNYDQIVLDDKKDVLVEFYAPWCGHCKALAPKYDQLGETYKKSEYKDKVVIAKVDATANDVPDEISGFPTIKLFPAGGKGAPVTYSGARTVDDLIEFIKENGKHKANVSIKEEATEEAAPAATEKDADKKKKKDAEKKKDDKKKDTDKKKEEAKKEEDDSHDEL